jgi:hypothetical protein
MKTLILLFAATFSFVTLAESRPVLTLQRVNYKPEKRLVYAVNYDPDKCVIDEKNPLEVYYRDNHSSERLTEFSNDSREYFGPRIDPAKQTDTAIELQFKALDEIQTKSGMPATITINVYRPSEATCEPYAEITYADKNFVLERIDLMARLFAGFPVGVKWVRLSGYDSEQEYEECVLGDCSQTEEK